MLRIAVVALLVTLLNQTPSQAQTNGAILVSTSQFELPFKQKQRVLWYGHGTNNDRIGERQGQWKAGPVTISRVWNAAWSGTHSTDRPQRGAFSIGAQTHFGRSTAEFSLGVVPQTKLQKGSHGLTNKPEPGAPGLTLQNGIQLHPTLANERVQGFQLGHLVGLGGFPKQRARGATLLRGGAGYPFGNVTKQELLPSKPVPGHRYRVIFRSETGLSLVVGGDVAGASQSDYLPENRGYQLTARRDKARLGLRWESKRASAFYGFSYLGREFEAKNEGQVIGSVRVKLSF